MGITERKEREKAERRRSILDAAREIIRSRPYEEITMEEISSRLELSRATLYLYFKNKNEIYATLLAEGMLELERGYHDLLSRGVNDPIEKLRGLAFVFLQFYAEHHSYFDLIVTKRGELLKDLSDETLELFQDAGARVIKPLVDVYREGISTGDFPDRPPEKMAWLLRAVGIGLAVGFREGNLVFPDDVALMEDLIMYGLRGRAT
ncbi:MAG: TetR/AcrR family transcriptional regulator [Spirochaetales bacterium]|nr:TetR/AcrR family transcriptional regulator [Leptospiraceae bacterium]MCP5480321.1 TetR/AcrR family transcriptional regulator [Spirochaetales bacterium]